MRRIINTNIRLDLSRQDDRQAYDYLLHMDRKQFKSYTRAVVAALNDFFSRREKLKVDPYLETREKEDRFLRQVLDIISEGIRQSMSQVQPTTKTQPDKIMTEQIAKEETSGIESENYEIAEAFWKEMGL